MAIASHLNAVVSGEVSDAVEAVDPPAAATLPQRRTLELAEVVLEHHLRLDEAIDRTLNAVVGDTEDSALAIIGQVRKLHDTAARLVAYLDDSTQTTGDLGKEVSDSVAQVAEVGAFIRHLPAKLERDLHSVQAVVKEIKGLDGLVGAVQAISMQSHLLAINAAIEASHAGKSGGAFRVVADEMRKLAANSSTVAASINQGLSRARHVVEHGMAASIEESTRQLEEVSLAAAAIQKVLANLEDINQYNKTRFTIVTRHNQRVVAEIAQVMGQIHYQDLVRLSIDRIRVAIGRRNALLQDALDMPALDGAGLARLPQQIELLLNDYLSEE